jgi:ribose transport system ATP-binding protein
MKPDDLPAQPSTPTPLLAVSGVGKSLGGTRILDDIRFDLLRGEVHAIVGENGAGKSTLMNILSGVLQPDAGDLHLDGERVHFDGPRAAQRAGIGTVFQELSLMPMLSVAENMFPNRAPVRRGGTIRWRALHDAAHALLAPLGVQVDVRMRVEQLPTSTRQLIEIAKALSLDARVLIMDEPTSALTANEVAALFKVMRGLTARGIGIIYISHHLHEVFELADRITVLRDGRRIDTLRTAQTDHDEIVRKMVGRDVITTHAARAKPGDATLLSAQGLTRRGHFEQIDFTLKAGEIVGLAGLAGCGRSELGMALAGVLRPTSGTLSVDGQLRRLRDLRDAMALGIAYLPAERKTDGLFLDHSLADNMIAATLGQFTRHGLIASARRDEIARSQCNALSIRAHGIHQPVGRLSGGNQQKVLLAKWLLTRPRVLIVEEPTRGIDIGAKMEIHALLRTLADKGTAILVISSDLPEVLALSGRIVVMHEGRLSGELDAANATEDDIMRYAVGRGAILSPQLSPSMGCPA